MAILVAVPMLIVLTMAPTRRIALPAAGALLAGLVGLVVLSTHRPDSLRPPQNDWLLPYLGLAIVASLLVFAVRLRRAAPEQRKTMLLSAGGVLVVLVCVGAIIGGRGSATPGSHRDLDVDSHDLYPFPAGLQHSGVDFDCQTGTGVCTDVLEFSSNADGQPLAAVAVQLAQHLRAKGWPMTAGGRADQFSGCLPIRGVFQWARQVCATVVLAQDFTGPARAEVHGDWIVLAIGAAPQT